MDIDKAIFDARTYIHLVDQFIENEDLPEPSLRDDLDNPLIGYLSNIMSDARLQVIVMTSKLRASIFRDMMVSFIIQVSQRIKYLYMQTSSERQKIKDVMHWSIELRQQGQHALLEELDDKYGDDDFDKDFFEALFSQNGCDDTCWEKLGRDWSSCLKNKLNKDTEREIHNRSTSIGSTDKIQKHIFSQEKYAETIGGNEEDYIKAWKMMAGTFTESEFRKQVDIIRLKNKFPQIEEVCLKMGRIANESGREMLRLSSGNRMKIEHSSGSDIEGITIGNDLPTVLPHEVAMFSDSSLENLFYQRYVTKQLQLFRYKSQLSKPSRRLNWEHATRKGPMIVCLDSSKSMDGIPHKIAISLLANLEDMAERLHRNCYLIDFSVSVLPIELCQRVKEFRLNSLGLTTNTETFAKGLFPFIGGGTNATKMMETAFDLLDNSANYQNADMLWISDFYIPMPAQELLMQMNNYRKWGTKIYGFQIGENKHQWNPYFDHIYQVHYQRPRLY